MQQQRASSGSDGVVQYSMDAPIDERKRKRMISNRESARRTRMKKQQELETLVARVSQLHIESGQLKQRISDASRLFTGVATENDVLRARVMELTDRLRSLNSVVRIADEVSGFATDVLELPDDSLSEPWQLPWPVQPIITSPNIFRCRAD